MVRLCLLALLGCMVGTAEAAPAPFPRPVRRPEKDPFQEFDKQLKARGVKSWAIYPKKRFANPVLGYFLPLPGKRGLLWGEVEIIGGDLLGAMKTTIKEIDETLAYWKKEMRSGDE